MFQIKKQECFVTGVNMPVLKSMLLTEKLGRYELEFSISNLSKCVNYTRREARNCDLLLVINKYVEDEQVHVANVKINNGLLPIDDCTSVNLNVISILPTAQDYSADILAGFFYLLNKLEEASKSPDFDVHNVVETSEIFPDRVSVKHIIGGALSYKSMWAEMYQLQGLSHKNRKYVNATSTIAVAAK